MKRILLAAGLAVMLHGLLWSLGTRLLPDTPLKRARPLEVTLTLSAVQSSEKKTEPQGYIPAPAAPQVAEESPPAEKKAEKRPDKKSRKEKTKAPEKAAETRPVPPTPAPVKKPTQTVQKTKRRQKKLSSRPKKASAAPKMAVQVKKEKTKPELEAMDKVKSSTPVSKKDAAEDSMAQLSPEVTEPTEDASSPPYGRSAFDHIPDEPWWGRKKEPSPVRSRTPSSTIKEATPDYRSNPVPPYPSRARRRGYEGTVTLKVLVDREGRVAELMVHDTSGYRMLDRAALRAVRDWRFIPGMRGNETIEMWVMVPVRFELH